MTEMTLTPEQHAETTVRDLVTIRSAAKLLGSSPIATVETANAEIALFASSFSDGVTFESIVGDAIDGTRDDLDTDADGETSVTYAVAVQYYAELLKDAAEHLDGDYSAAANVWSAGSLDELAMRRLADLAELIEGSSDLAEAILADELGF